MNTDYRKSLQKLQKVTESFHDRESTGKGQLLEDTEIKLIMTSSCSSQISFTVDFFFFYLAEEIKYNSISLLWYVVLSVQKLSDSKLWLNNREENICPREFIFIWHLLHILLIAAGSFLPNLAPNSNPIPSPRCTIGLRSGDCGSHFNV